MSERIVLHRERVFFETLGVSLHNRRFSRANSDPRRQVEMRYAPPRSRRDIFDVPAKSRIVVQQFEISKICLVQNVVQDRLVPEDPQPLGRLPACDGANKSIYGPMSSGAIESD